MLTVSRRRPSWSLAWATWTSPWVSTPTVTRVGWACAMVVMAISLRLRAWGGWHAPAGWADSTAMGLWAQASIRSRLLGWRCEAVAAASSRQIRSRARSRWTAGVRPLPRPPETSSQWTLGRIAEVIERTTGVAHHPGHVWRLLKPMRWSRQRPARKAIERDEAEIARWVAQEWPRIKQRPNAQSRALLCRRVGGQADPAGAADLGTARADAGAAPPLPAWQAAVDVRAGGLPARPGRPGGAGDLDGLRAAGGRLRHPPVHPGAGWPGPPARPPAGHGHLGQPRRPPRRRPAGLGGHPVVAGACVPAVVAPELDPVEGLWANLKGRELANRCCADRAELIATAQVGSIRARRDPELLCGFLAGTGLTL